MEQSRTQETRCRDTRPRDARGHWHMGQGTPGASGDIGHILAALHTGTSSAPQKGGGLRPWGRDRLRVKSARGREE